MSYPCYHLPVPCSAYHILDRLLSSPTISLPLVLSSALSLLPSPSFDSLFFTHLAGATSLPLTFPLNDLSRANCTSPPPSPPSPSPSPSPVQAEEEARRQEAQ
jgi:hypothetical protein